MQIQTTTNGLSSTIDINTIGIAIDSKQPERTFYLHCAYCGRDLFQAQGKLVRFVPWLEPTNDPVIIQKCTRAYCEQRFTVQLAKFRKTVFVRFPNRERFHCLICHLQFEGNKCMRCQTTYDFNEAL